MGRVLRITAALACFALLLASSALATTSAEGRQQDDQLIIAGYGGTTPGNYQKYVLDQFSKDTGIQVTQLQVGGQQVAGVSAQNAAGNIQWDMTMGLADTDMATLWKAGYLATIPARLLAIEKKIHPDMTNYAIPAKRGAAMIGCNYKLVPNCPKTAKQLLDAKKYPGPRMFASFQPLVLLGFAGEALGMKPKDIFPNSLSKSMKNLDREMAFLSKFKPNIKAFYSNGNQATQLLESGEVVYAGLWNTNSKLLHFTPTSHVSYGASWTGAVTYTQYDVVYKGAPHEANAWKLMEWMATHPQAMAQFAANENAGITDPRVQAMLSPAVRTWMPSKIKRPQTVDTNAVWYIQWPTLKQRIDDWWKAYTAG
jgi:putative spermidine/putrescine transport system substrate-binding protein